ncbi:MAG TPA: hypothetical protein VJM69_01625 [Dehalococcoidia bacterium]|nr:hypothetical protein [Dehalococcoidia bacterium]
MVREGPSHYVGALARAGRAPEEGVSRRRRRSQEEDAFRARMEERLWNLEQQLAEVRGRINTLFFLTMGAVLIQVVLKLIEG